MGGWVGGVSCRRRRDIKPNSCLAFVNFSDILQNVDDSKRSEISRNGYYQLKLYFRQYPAIHTTYS